MENKKIFASFLIVLIVSTFVTARPQDLDLVERDADGEQPNQSWVRRQLIRAGEAAARFRSGVGGYARRQLMKAGEAASRVGSGVGGYAVKLTNAVDRICQVIKKIIPIVGAVCTVGQFQFCSLDNAGGAVGDTVDGLAIAGRSLGSDGGAGGAGGATGVQTDFDEVDKRK